MDVTAVAMNWQRLPYFRLEAHFLYTENFPFGVKHSSPSTLEDGMWLFFAQPAQIGLIIWIVGYASHSIPSGLSRSLRSRHHIFHPFSI
jgi:hypothetical protein